MNRRSIQYDQYGDPRKVCRLVHDKIATDVDGTDVLVQWLASPVNPLDINKIQGAYVVQLPLPSIAGSEAVGRVIKIGPSVSSLKAGDQVVILTFSCPTWADYAIVDEDALLKIDSRIPPNEGATLLINPPTAWVMLRMGNLNRGDWIVQNSANSGVGRAAIQIAKAKGYRTINIVRDRPDIERLKSELKSMGADEVWTEEEVKGKSREWRGRPKLALNGVGGKSCLQIAGLLAKGGLLVTYGGMSKKAHEISTSALVFNDIKAVGVAIGMWMIQEENKEEVKIMLKEIQEMMLRRELTAPPMDEWTLEDYQKALDYSMDGKHQKQIFIIQRESAKM